MKITVEISDELFRRAKAEAALRGRKLKDLVEEGLRLVLGPRQDARRPSFAGLMKGARGAVDSRIPDLASNPKHLAGFGRMPAAIVDTGPLVAFFDRASDITPGAPSASRRSMRRSSSASRCYFPKEVLKQFLCISELVRSPCVTFRAVPMIARLWPRPDEHCQTPQVVYRPACNVNK